MIFLLSGGLPGEPVAPGLMEAYSDDPVAALLLLADDSFSHFHAFRVFRSFLIPYHQARYHLPKPQVKKIFFGTQRFFCGIYVKT